MGFWGQWGVSPAMGQLACINLVWWEESFCWCELRSSPRVRLQTDSAASCDLCEY